MKAKIKIVRKRKFEFKDVLEKISFTDNEHSEIEGKVEYFYEKLKNASKNAEVFIGGSFSKGTMMKKNHADIDIFMIFPYDEKKPSDKLKSILKKLKLKFNSMHGSRDYYQINDGRIIYEIVPIVKIDSASQAKNITDISPLHVRWLLGKLAKKKKLAEEIMLGKSFCYGNNCYGAESYISGFSGYALEVLIVYYGGFMNFLKNAVKWKFDKKKKIIIDPEKYYKNEKEVLDKLNQSKIFGPLILIDPVQKERNVCAALNEETLNIFIENAKKFLKKPSEEFFYKKPVNTENLKKKGELFVLEASSNKDKIDIIGAKLRKFFDFLVYLSEKEGFHIVEKEIEFDENTKEAIYYFVIKPQDKLLVRGPPLKIEQKFVEGFKKRWPNAFEKNGRLYAESMKKFPSYLDMIKSVKKGKIMKQMNIKSLEVVGE